MTAGIVRAWRMIYDRGQLFSVNNNNSIDQSRDIAVDEGTIKVLVCH